ncbi:MAG: Hemerythrin cation binding domain protein [Alphaproteobacteria bacterium]|nr:Hemerythrin cation binding domain protein [Alphaproteobacteria bacterium]
MTVMNTIEDAAKSVVKALTPGESQPDVLDTLAAEHDEVQELLGKLTESDNAREQTALVARIKKALIPHSKAEEAIVYDAIIALKDESSKVDGHEGYTEHALASATLTQLDTLEANTPEFKASAKVLKELLDHHIKEEENNVWSDVKKNFSAEQRERMNRDYLAAKQKVLVA